VRVKGILSGLVMLSLAMGQLTSAPARKPAPAPPTFHIWNLNEADKFIKYLRRRTVRVEVTGKLPKLFDPLYPPRLEGGGAVLSPGLVLTSSHYLVSVKKVECINWRGEKYAARIAYQDAMTGLALLAIDDKRFKKFARSVRLPGKKKPLRKVKAHVYVLGNYGLNWRQIRDGLITMKRGMFFGRVSLLLRNGVPLFDIHGQLKAMAFRITQDWAGSYVIPEHAIRIFLKQIRKKGFLAKKGSPSPKAKPALKK